MRMRSFNIERLEGRQFLSVTPASISAPAAFVDAAVTDHYSMGARTIIYSGTATNQNGNTSKITILVTDMRGVREGVLYVNNGKGGKTPVSFTINGKLEFSFKFSQVGEKNTVVGKLGADGSEITATWTSISSSGVKGGGSVTATRT